MQGVVVVVGLIDPPDDYKNPEAVNGLSRGKHVVDYSQELPAKALNNIPNPNDGGSPKKLGNYYSLVK